MYGAHPRIAPGYASGAGGWDILPQMSWTPGLAQTPRKILLIQLRRIGDAVLVTPALDALRDAWPEAELHLLTADPVPQLFEGDSRLNRVWVRPSRSRLPALGPGDAR